MPKWTFVRHGESTANAEGRLAGHRDVGLTVKGQEQAKTLGAELRGFSFDRVLVSDLRRAQHTLKLALPDARPTVLPGLRERSMGEWEHADRDALRALGGFGALLEWSKSPPGGESLAQLFRRVVGTLAAHEGAESTLVVCHGGVMRVALGALDGASAEELARWKVPNCSIETRPVEHGGWAALLDR